MIRSIHDYFSLAAANLIGVANADSRIGCYFENSRPNGHSDISATFGQIDLAIAYSLKCGPITLTRHLQNVLG